MPNIDKTIDSTRGSRAGHTFHERWTARRALQLVFPNDELFAIAVEGISSTETASPGKRAEEVADLVLYYGCGDSFQTCERLETVQFKYKFRSEAVTAAYLKKTIKKFSDTILGYEKSFSAADVNKKAWFSFVTNAEFTESLRDAIKSLIDGTTPSVPGAANQVRNLRKWCAESGLADASRLFTKTEFRARAKNLSGQENELRRTLTDWSAGADSEARLRMHALQHLVLEKAGPSGQDKNLIHREDVLDALDCEPEDLFPADTRFIDVGAVVERAELSTVGDLIKASETPVFVHAEAGVGKTVFVQSLAVRMASELEVIVFDCFGGGSYRSENHSRHLCRIGMMQIVNELASRGLCDLMLPSGDDSRRIIKAARKRLAQAATAIRTQSDRHGLLIIVDAADNAHLEAKDRQENDFPRLLLTTIDEDPIDGVKLLLTARTHRKDDVIDRAKVNAVELGPFTDSEAREFLSDRKPRASGVETITALARSRRNARVLDYLVKSWETNVLGRDSAAPITVPEIIAQQCGKVVSDLRIVGWADAEVTEFFVAISLLPPPIPLEDLANALGWSASQVNSAGTDLAPMLEITSHGAIFRDEPTETYIRETYSGQREAQRAIADRLLSSQETSTYAAEALPHFLVIIKDSDRAFALADSTKFPTTVQSVFGRRRLTLVRLRAAFRLAVAENDFDRVLGLSMRLAQAATANMRGDVFIRRSPALAIVLGDTDSYRRLFADRSGWRGARSARLTISHRFAGDTEDAQIQCESTVRWINWYVARPHDETTHDGSGPDVDDFAAVLFHHVAEGEFGIADRNLARWSDRFSLCVSDKLLELLELFDQTNSTGLLPRLVSFAASNQCTSQALKIRLLSHPRLLSRRQLKALANTVKNLSPTEDDEHAGHSIDPERSSSDDRVQAALSALIHSSRASSAAIIRGLPFTRPSAYDYGEHYGYSRAWLPSLGACMRAWSAGSHVTYHDLLPSEVKVTKQAKAVSTKSELVAFLKSLHQPAPDEHGKSGGKKQLRRKFNDRAVREISDGIALLLELMLPIEHALTSGKGLKSASVTDFLNVWGEHMREGAHWQSERSVDLLARTAGLGCVHILLTHATRVSADQAQALIRLISCGRFSVQQRIDVLDQLARRPALHNLAGEFAQHTAKQIREDDNVGQRGEYYAKLAASLVPMSLNEAREYYRQGLAQLDQMGGESYDQIYSLLHFASVQRGGFLKPALAQRLMNLCQTIVQNDPRKFGWTLFSRAAANSIGFPAIAQLVRWHDQDVAELSYGLPQLACFLAKYGKLDPRRAAYILTICEDHGWWDWRSGDAVAELLHLAAPEDQMRIVRTILAKLHAEHPFDAWPALWEGYLKLGKLYPSAVTMDEREAIELLLVDSTRKQDECNSRSIPPQEYLGNQTPEATNEEIETLIAAMISDCSLPTASSIDSALNTIEMNNELPFDARHRFILGLRTSCSYSNYLAFLQAVCEAKELHFPQSIDILVECFAAWSGSAKHLAANAKELVECLFECKGAELFDGQSSSIARGIRQMSDFCGDRRAVLQLVLRKIAADEVELDGDEWLQLATALCDVTSDQAGLDAMELLLAGPASRIADEIGQGPFRPEQTIRANEVAVIADVIWHLLGDADAYVRWTVSRGMSALVELGLHDDLGVLLDRFDQSEVAALASTGLKLSFQNSQQWLLMGLARTAWRHGQVMGDLRPKLLGIAKRSDLHVINKVHIVRCLRAIGSGEETDAELDALLDEINQPPHGVVSSDDYPSHATPTSGFQFDYEFAKTEISTLVHLFNVTQATVEDAIATEITCRWPDAKSMEYFSGHERHRWDRDDRYEFYREHIQRHALLSAATSLSKKIPVVARSYDSGCPWLNWRSRYDVTFDDGSWLSDRKDPVPQQAKENLLDKRIGNQDTLQDQEAMLRKLGFLDCSDTLLPLYGRWTSPDGVTVNITSALTSRKGAIGLCTAFAKQPSHSFWLPEFWDEGYYNPLGRQKSPFAPLVWAPETHSLGIDVGDELAAEGAGGRPRLGIDITKSLKLANEPNSGHWRAANGNLALKSEVWGCWKPDPDYMQSRHHDDGKILWASPDWLAATLSNLNKRLVFTVALWKYRSSRNYDPSSGIKSVVVGLRLDDGTLRFWSAKKASKQDF